MSYMAFKHLHLLAVVLTLVFFLARSGGLVMGMQWINKSWARSTQHLIDLVILASALGLCYYLAQWPFYNSAWITAKFIALVGYMGLTAFAFKRRKLLLIAAPLVFLIYAAWVAVNRVPFPGF